MTSIDSEIKGIPSIAETRNEMKKKPLGADLKKKLGLGSKQSTPPTTTKPTAAATSAELDKLKKKKWKN